MSIQTIQCQSNTGNTVSISINQWANKINGAYRIWGTKDKVAKLVKLELGLTLKSARYLTRVVLDGGQS